MRGEERKTCTAVFPFSGHFDALTGYIILQGLYMLPESQLNSPINSKACIPQTTCLMHRYEFYAQILCILMNLAGWQSAKEREVLQGGYCCGCSSGEHGQAQLRCIPTQTQLAVGPCRREHGHQLPSKVGK